MSNRGFNAGMVVKKGRRDRRLHQRSWGVSRRQSGVMNKGFEEEIEEFYGGAVNTTAPAHTTLLEFMYKGME